MTGPRMRYIAELVDVHADGLAFVWGQRRAALRSRRHGLRELASLDERIEAHLQGLLIAPPTVLASRFEQGLVEADRDEAFASAYALLRLDEESSAQAVMVEFSRAGGPVLAGLRDALSVAPTRCTAAELRSAFDHAKPATAAAAAVVLANHRMLDGRAPRLAALLEEADTHSCAAAWQAVLLADAGTQRETHGQRPYRHALSHAAPTVRHAAWAAGAWRGEGWTMPLLREAAARADAVALHWLAILGIEEDLPLLQQAVLAMEGGPARCALLARFGHPSALAALVRWMTDGDMALAAAAGEAFTRITGIEVRGERRQLAVADDADEFEREMAPEVWMPDAGKARDALERHGGAWNAGTRWCRGIHVDGDIDRAAFAAMDFELRWDIGARSALDGRPISVPPPIF